MDERQQKQGRRAAQPREYWLGLVEEYKASGIGLEEFCAGRGIIPGTFKNWVYKRRRLRPRGTAGFEEVKLPAALATEYRRIVRTGRELVLQGFYDIGRVRELIAVMEERDV